jgi:hypothetical protein
MNRTTLAAAIAALGLTMFATAQIQADGHHNNGSGHQQGTGNRQGVASGHRGEVGHSFRANGRFEYGRHGFRSLSWTRYGWSDRYRTYCYWEPRYGWCFYEPTYSYYLPIGRFKEVYPEAVLTAAPELPVREFVREAPAVIQKTSVIVGAPTGPAVGLPIPPVVPPVGPAPAVLQQTKVNAGVP